MIKLEEGKYSVVNKKRFDDLNKNNEYELLYLDFIKIKYKHLKCGHITEKSLDSFRRNQGCSRKECIQKKIDKVKTEKYGKDYRKLATKKARKTNLEKYGSENLMNIKEIKEKVKRTCLERYGKDNALKIKKFREKGKTTKLKKYGDKNYNNREQAKETCLERYGVEHSSQIEEVKIKKEQTFMEKYGKKTSLLDEKIQEKIKNSHAKNYYNNKILNFKVVIPLFKKKEYEGIYKEYAWQCKKCGNIFKKNLINGLIPRCLKCYPIKIGTSNQELEIADWLNIPEENRNKRFYYSGKSFHELDIYLPESNLGIELNGLYWHSEVGKQKDKNYHNDKTNFFLDKDIQVLHIWDYEWINKQDIVKSIIMSKLGKIENIIFARKTEIREVDSDSSRIFLNKNHIQGEINSSVRLGLFYKNELVSIFTAGKSRFNKNYDYEIHRFCNKLNTGTIGGFSKLLKHFTDNYGKSIITYADRRYSDGGLYKNNGFNLINTSPPNYFYTINYLGLESRNKYQKHKLPQLLENFDNSLTEWENMQMNGYDRIWDCGNYVYELKEC
jgi:predicted  nucleic acid-binding Zn-ribbon protein